MKVNFFEHFGYSEEQFNYLWDNCLFSFDTNVLLNLYRYSEDTKNKFISIFESLNDRIWITNKVMHEFLNSRLEVIKEKYLSYDETLKQIENLLNDLQQGKEHPFFDKNIKGTHDNLILYAEEFKNKINEKKDNYIKLLSYDEVLHKLGELFTNHVGEGFSEEETSEIFEEGKKRFDDNIPPGYKDKDKKRVPQKEEKDLTYKEKLRKYGDLIIWKELIDKSYQSNNSIIFITDEIYEDWWLNCAGKTVQPRPELIREFYDEAQKLFYMYKPLKFLELASEKYLHTKIEDEIYKEVRDTDNIEKPLDIMNTSDVVDDDYDTKLLNYYLQKYFESKEQYDKKASYYFNQNSDANLILIESIIDNLGTISKEVLKCFGLNNDLHLHEIYELLKLNSNNTDEMVVGINTLIKYNAIKEKEKQRYEITNLGRELLNYINAKIFMS